MCGIHGILATEAELERREDVVLSMGEMTLHRGPDDAGIYKDAEVVFGMRRLSIIDVDGGHQPISNETGTVWAVCNGEIYNFRELRRDLIARGHEFTSESDSEVVVHLYEEYGTRAVEKLEGMFGLALWDTTRRRLLVARDRLGIKPLYYAQIGRALAFSSEAKALTLLPSYRPGVDAEALRQYLCLGYVPAPLSLYQGVRKLEPGCLLTAVDGGITVERYWEYRETTDRSLDDEEWADRFRAVLGDCVQKQMVSDVPLGAFLSGGIDSSAIVAMMSRFSDIPVKTYSVGFDTGPAAKFYNELPYARQVASDFSTDHHEIIVRPDVVELLPKLLWHMDEPVADSAFITTYLVSEFARREVKVILSGVGGDELFGGYRRYLGEYYLRGYRRLPEFVRRRVVTSMLDRLPSNRDSFLPNLFRLAKGFANTEQLSLSERYRSYVGVFTRAVVSQVVLSPQESSEEDALDAAFDKRASRDPINALMEVDLKTQLPDDLLMLTDRMSMATSLECRVPLLDERMVELAAAMPADLKVRGRRLKHVMKQGLENVLPREVLYRAKRGFGVPMGAWLKAELGPVAKGVLSEANVRSRGLLDWRFVEETMQRHAAGREDCTDHIQALMNLELWCQLYLDAKSPAQMTEELRAVVAQ